MNAGDKSRGNTSLMGSAFKGLGDIAALLLAAELRSIAEMPLDRLR